MHPFFSIISSQSGFIEMDLLQKMFLLVGHEKNVIHSKLVNNPFNKVIFRLRCIGFGGEERDGREGETRGIPPAQSSHAVL